jgi:hypothetical protein
MDECVPRPQFVIRCNVTDGLKSDSRHSGFSLAFLPELTATNTNRRQVGLPSFTLCLPEVQRTVNEVYDGIRDTLDDLPMAARDTLRTRHLIEIRLPNGLYSVPTP